MRRFFALGRSFVAVALALSLLAGSLSGCSQPIDTGSSIPAQSQPIVALLALVGLGIGLTAWHHHNEKHGTSPGPTIVGAAVFQAPFIANYLPVDLSPNGSGSGGTGTGTMGVLEAPTAGGSAKYTEVFITSSGSGNTVSSVGSYVLPPAYVPRSLGVDPSGNAWFDDQAGKIYACAPLTSSSSTCSVAAGALIDGLASGNRSIAVDGSFFFVVQDGGGGKVNYAWLPLNPLGTSFTRGTYQSGSTAGIFASDAVKPTPSTVGTSGFTVFHTDGTSDLISFNASGSSVTVSNTTSFSYRPVPVSPQSDYIGTTPNGTGAFYGLSGSASATYQLSRYSSATNSGVSIITSTANEAIEVNGQFGGSPFAGSLFALRGDAAESLLWTIDQHGNLVGFALF